MTVSIIIPAYNAEQYIDRCFASVFRNAPSEELFEVIAVNDGSKDNTLELLKKQSEQHRNVIVINQPNSGVSVARNNGIEAAKGEYVLFLDADDELIEGSLSRLCAYLSEKCKIDMLMTRQVTCKEGVYYHDQEPNLVEHKVYSGLEAYQNCFVRTNAGGGICRRNFLKQYGIVFPEGVTNGEDTLFFAQVQVFAKSIVYFNLPLYQINVLVDSATRNKDPSKGARLFNSIKAAVDIKTKMMVDNERKGIFDYAIYQLISNTVSFYAGSKELSFASFYKGIDFPNILPLNTRYMCMMRNKAKIMNCSITLFYFLSWLKIIINR